MGGVALARVSQLTTMTMSPTCVPAGEVTESPVPNVVLPLTVGAAIYTLSCHEFVSLRGSVARRGLVGIDIVESAHGIGGDLDFQFPVGIGGKGQGDALDQFGDIEVIVGQGVNLDVVGFHCERFHVEQCSTTWYTYPSVVLPATSVETRTGARSLKPSGGLWCLVVVLGTRCGTIAAAFAAIGAYAGVVSCSGQHRRAHRVGVVGPLVFAGVAGDGWNRRGLPSKLTLSTHFSHVIYSSTKQPRLGQTVTATCSDVMRGGSDG